ncbi:MAG TPA: NAD-dependent epimerase/dehydratase family protein [Nitriliruptoraceae bacterium]|nr:NAD-dependent epimerase/dehydratase family protein [Nitriliruptoraceae bacterium]
MATIAITGISGFLGQRVHEHFRTRGHTIVGVDLHAPDDSQGLVFHEADVRSRADIATAFAGADAVVHLATASRDGQPDHGVNVGGSQVVISEAVAAGVDTLVVMSSAMVYGAQPDNPVPLDESAPLRGDGDFALAAQKVAVEHLVEPLLGTTGPRTVVLRPAMMVGADSQNLLTRALQGSRVLAVKGHNPPVQFVHVDDVASAIQLAVDSDMSGAYNVACEGWLPSDEMGALLDRRVLVLPEEIAWTAIDRSHALGISRLPASGLPWIMWPWVVSVDRLVAQGWQPSIGNRDAAALLGQETATVHVGGVEADRRTVRRVGIAAGVVGGVLAMGALARRGRSDTRQDADGRDAQGDDDGDSSPASEDGSPPGDDGEADS